MAIHPAYRTAKQGKDDARKIINLNSSNPTRMLFGVSVHFSTVGNAKDCTAAYRRAFFDTITLKA